MNSREAKKSVCSAAARILESSAEGPGLWMQQDSAGNELGDADKGRMEKAFQELIDELDRRAE